MELLEAIHARRSYRGQYLPDAVPREDLRKIMEAALAAPSGCNLQTTSVIAVDDPALKRDIAAIVKKPWIASAPAGICVLAREQIGPRGVSYHVQDYAAAIENALLAITALGYESCWLEGYVTYVDGIGRAIALKLAQDGCDVAILYAGRKEAADETVALLKRPAAAPSPSSATSPTARPPKRRSRKWRRSSAPSRCWSTTPASCATAWPCACPARTSAPCWTSTSPARST